MPDFAMLEQKVCLHTCGVTLGIWIDHGLVPCAGIMADAGFQRDILLHQFKHRVFSAMGHDMVKQIRLNLPFLLSQRKLPLFPPGRRIILIQTPAVHILFFAVFINVTVAIPPICTLVFTITQNPFSIIPPFFAHGISPLTQEEPDLQSHHTTNLGLRTVCYMKTVILP